MAPANLPNDMSLSRVSKFSDDQELPRPFPVMTDKDSTERIHRHAKEDTNNRETAPDVYGNEVIYLCFRSVLLSECVDGWCNVVFRAVRV